MADKKEPPFFNEDNVGPFQFRLPSCDTMELFIETLTGTSFQLRVSPFETLLSVKAKIQRLEGILVAQQHLIWNNVELEDEYCLHDYNITDGSTLKLVLAMRGGPINTRRVAVDDSVKEMADYMEAGRDEAWEKAPPNKQVTYLVYREGDQLNFFRVVDRGDGTLTPVSESVRGGSVYNLCAEEEELDGVGSGQQALENSITMTKMKLLKAKMEDMNLNKKPKKTAKLKPRPPGGPRPCSGYLAPSRHHRPLRILPQIGQPLAPAAHLPPARDPKSAHLSLSSVPVPAPAGRTREPEGEDPWESPVAGKILPPPELSRLEVGGAELVRDRTLPPLSVLASRGSPDGAVAEPHPKGGGAALIDEPQKALPFDEQEPDPVTFDLPSQEVGRGDSLATVAEQLPVVSLLPQAVGSDSVDSWAGGAHCAPARAEFGPRCASPELPVASGPAQRPPQFAAGASWPASSLSLLKAEERPGPALTPPSRSARFRVVRADSPDARPEARDSPLGPLSRAGLLATLSRSRSREGGPARPCASIRLIQEDLLLGPTATFMSSNRSPGGAASSVRRGGTPTYLLPPVKAAVSSRKKSSKHCFLCRKKTGLATSFQCRCGNNFCATHRYAETHDCSYDYKAAGRRFLQEANPIVSAPKLPKI